MRPRVHPLEALAAAMVTVAYREGRRTSERTWAEERRRLARLNGPGPADPGPMLNVDGGDGEELEEERDVLDLVDTVVGRG